MAVHLQKEIEKLKKRIILYGGMIEKNLENAIHSIQEKDAELAQTGAWSRTTSADQWEVDTEEECLKILALHQPVAVDLRFIIAVLKINNDLERIGDEAVNIAERSLRVSPLTLPGPRSTFHLFASACRKRCGIAWTRWYGSTPRWPTRSAARTTRSTRWSMSMFVQLKDEIKKYPEQTDQLVEYLRVCRHLERIADHATNIAEDVIYMIEGSIVRHRQEMQ